MSELQSSIPLPERMRPKSLEDFVGQSHLIGPKGAITQALQQGIIPSMIFWGPPGVGKTTLAQLIAEKSERSFQTLSAINSGVKDVRAVIDRARSGGMFASSSPILFIDEIHRFSKSQQDSLLGAVEKGWITLIGATTENPSFEVISALRSRCQIYVLKQLEKSDLVELLERALKHDAQLKPKSLKLKESDTLLLYSGGDARRMLNALELVANTSKQKEITNEVCKEILQELLADFDKGGEQHYDIISAFIKSIRGSDADASMYWLARMIRGGEDPKFIARRLLILASEDIGLANPTAMVLANTCFQVAQAIGNPECELTLAQTTLYLAKSQKSNSAYTALGRAKKLAEEFPSEGVPLHLRNAPSELMKDLDYGKDYKYPHDYPGNWVEQSYLPKALLGKQIYKPGKNKREES